MPRVLKPECRGAGVPLVPSMTIISTLRDAKHLLAPLTANCREFHDRWERATRDSSRIAGRWEGEWVSEANGHRGPLRCVLETLADGRWRATFHAGYAGVFRACYATELTAAASGSGWTFEGESDIGWLAGGVYRCEGDATDSAFTARYRSRYDNGRFQLHRATSS